MDANAEIRFRAYILLLLAEGVNWEIVGTLLFCSFRAIDRWIKRFNVEGVEAVTKLKPFRPFRIAAGLVSVLVAWATSFSLSTLASCAAAGAAAAARPACEPRDDSPDSFQGFVYRTHRPVLEPKNEHCVAKPTKLQRLLDELAADFRDRDQHHDWLKVDVQAPPSQARDSGE